MNRIRDCSNWRLTIVGQARLLDELEYCDAMRQKVKTLNLEDRISLLKDIPYSDMPDLYKAHDLFVLPSEKEKYGMVILEAMAFGLDVIPSDGCGAAFCVDEAGGDVFHAGKADSLSGILRRKLNNPSEIQCQGNRNEEYIRNNCSFGQYIDMLAYMINDNGLEMLPVN